MRGGVKIGIMLDEKLKPEGFDLYFHYVKRVGGKISKPITRSYNVVSCFGDNKTACEKPGLIATSEAGKATRKEGRGRFHWDWICPTNEEYCSFLLDLIKQTSKEGVKGIHLDSIRFPGEGYCTCERCTKKWKGSGLEWLRWKQQMISEFVQQASNLVNQEFSITLYPDPFYPERFGLDLDSLSQFADFFVIPIYDSTYSTLYWIDILANAFNKRLKKPFYIGLYAKEAKIKDLTRAAILASQYCSGVLFSHDLKKATEMLSILKNLNEFR